MASRDPTRFQREQRIREAIEESQSSDSDTGSDDSGTDDSGSSQDRSGSNGGGQPSPSSSDINQTQRRQQQARAGVERDSGRPSPTGSDASRTQREQRIEDAVEDAEQTRSPGSQDIEQSQRERNLRGAIADRAGLDDNESQAYRNLDRQTDITLIPGQDVRFSTSDGGDSVRAELTARGARQELRTRAAGQTPFFRESDLTVRRVRGRTAETISDNPVEDLEVGLSEQGREFNRLISSRSPTSRDIQQFQREVGRVARTDQDGGDVFTGITRDFERGTGIDLPDWEVLGGPGRVQAGRQLILGEDAPTGPEAVGNITRPVRSTIRDATPNVGVFRSGDSIVRPGAATVGVGVTGVGAGASTAGAGAVGTGTGTGAGAAGAGAGATIGSAVVAGAAAGGVGVAGLQRSGALREVESAGDAASYDTARDVRAVDDLTGGAVEGVSLFGATVTGAVAQEEGFGEGRRDRIRRFFDEDGGVREGVGNVGGEASGEVEVPEDGDGGPATTTVDVGDVVLTSELAVEDITTEAEVSVPEDGGPSTTEIVDTGESDAAIQTSAIADQPAQDDGFGPSLPDPGETVEDRDTGRPFDEGSPAVGGYVVGEETTRSQEAQEAEVSEQDAMDFEEGLRESLRRETEATSPPLVESRPFSGVTADEDVGVDTVPRTDLGTPNQFATPQSVGTTTSITSELGNPVETETPNEPQFGEPTVNPPGTGPPRRPRDPDAGGSDDDDTEEEPFWLVDDEFTTGISDVEDLTADGFDADVSFDDL